MFKLTLVTLFLFRLLHIPLLVLLDKNYSRVALFLLIQISGWTGFSSIVSSYSIIYFIRLSVIKNHDFSDCNLIPIDFVKMPLTKEHAVKTQLAKYALNY